MEQMRGGGGRGGGVRGLAGGRGGYEEKRKGKIQRLTSFFGC